MESIQEEDQDMKENMQRSANRGVDLLELLQNLWRSASIIFLGAVVIAALTFLATKLLVVPTYQAKFTAYVNNKSESTTTLSSSDLSASQYLTNTFAEIVNSRSVLESAAKRAERAPSGIPTTRQGCGRLYPACSLMAETAAPYSLSFRIRSVIYPIS